MLKHLPWRNYNLVCGANRKWLKTGRALTVGGLIMAAVGYAITTDATWTFDHPGDYQLVEDFVADTLDKM